MRGQYQHGRGDQATKTGPPVLGRERTGQATTAQRPWSPEHPTQAAALGHSGQLGFSASVWRPC